VPVPVWGPERGQVPVRTGTGSVVLDGACPGSRFERCLSRFGASTVPVPVWSPERGQVPVRTGTGSVVLDGACPGLEPRRCLSRFAVRTVPVPVWGPVRTGTDTTRDAGKGVSPLSKIKSRPTFKSEKQEAGARRSLHKRQGPDAVGGENRLEDSHACLTFENSAGMLIAWAAS
jgi:hypothetical protein